MADRAGRRDHAHAIVAEIRDVEVARAVHGQAQGRVQLRAGGLAAVAREAGRAVARHGADRAAARDLLDARVLAIGDVEVPGGIHGQSFRQVELAGRAVAQHVVDSAARVHDAHDVVEAVGDIKIAPGIGRHGPRRIELRAGGRAVIARVGVDSVAREGRDIAALSGLADAQALGIGDVHVARGIHRDPGGRVERRVEGRAIRPRHSCCIRSPRPC